jgi:ubiquinone/menaquinone biosynthesis C-methylase UbiE
MNKKIDRDHGVSKRLFDRRGLDTDYATIVPILTIGLRVLDVGCGTGSISNDIAKRVGPTGHVTGIDNTEKFIVSGIEKYKATSNLKLIHEDLFNYNTDESFDLIVSARTLQWMSNPLDAIKKMKSLLKPGGVLSVLDYNHEAIEWEPEPPQSMQLFYRAFLRWRAVAGMNNHIASDLGRYFQEAGLSAVSTFNSDEACRKHDKNFLEKMSIWSKVASLKQIVEEGYITEELRLKAIEEYDSWIKTGAERMLIKLNEVRGISV